MSTPLKTKQNNKERWWKRKHNPPNWIKTPKASIWGDGSKTLCMRNFLKVRTAMDTHTQKAEMKWESIEMREKYRRKRQNYSGKNTN